MSVITHNGKVVVAENGKALNLDSLIEQANQTTGANDKTLGGAVQTLVGGWHSGASLSSISVKKNRYRTYFLGELFNPSGLTITATYTNGATRDITTGFTYQPTTALTEEDTVIHVSYTENGTTKSADTPIVVVYEQDDFDPILDNNTWLTIRAASERGVAQDYWSIGDTHRITLNGTMHDSTDVVFDDFETNVFIIGFDHNAEVEGYGITFHGFKHYNADTDTWLNTCLMSTRMNASNTNSGGWKKSRARNVVLGSTDTVNEDASESTATSPVANSLMSCLPSDLRMVMRPITKWTDNNGGGQGSVEEYVTPTVDYLPLLAENEIFGKRSYCNASELAYTKQYAYYVAGNSKVKSSSILENIPSGWWERSPYATYTGFFCHVSTSGGAYRYSAYNAYGVAPCFLV